MQPGEWQRWRVVFGSWLFLPLKLTISGDDCEMQLLAKDGVYIEDFPRLITNAPIPTGGRADIMVRCASDGVFTVSDYANTLMTLKVEGSSTTVSSELPEWSPERPEYLEDLQEETVAAECICDTSFSPKQPDCTDGGTHCINKLSFNSERFIHTAVYGSVMERVLSGVTAHPYHQHVYPYQIIEIDDDTEALTDVQKTYFKTGDWHDVLMIRNVGDVTMRYLPEVHLGRIMLHCHRLDHEDKGMMAQEEVVHPNVGSCVCDANAPRATCVDSETWEAAVPAPTGKKPKKPKKTRRLHDSNFFGCPNISEDLSRCDISGDTTNGGTDTRIGREACPQSCGICAVAPLLI
jgi:FtsP/CotA-like multicopper oxidase with cupredoxin domain